MDYIVSETIYDESGLLVIVNENNTKLKIVERSYQQNQPHIIYECVKNL